jgi:hypothetical protein
MDHDPYCPAPRDWWRTCICDLVAQVRDAERWATVEGAVVIASQSGASPELVQLLSAMYERPEVPGADEMRREAAAELTRLAQEMGFIP